MKLGVPHTHPESRAGPVPLSPCLSLGCVLIIQLCLLVVCKDGLGLAPAVGDDPQPSWEMPGGQPHLVLALWQFTCSQRRNLLWLIF